tara:strand:+ start:1336 stop:1545 length:210 start_codon:yes stop_codon:yes gene_type:complete
MDEEELKTWSEFRSVKKGSITNKEFKLICFLHSKYYNHKYHEPCSCRPTEIKQWIGDLNLLYDEYKKDQ